MALAVRVDISGLTKGFKEIKAKQLPYARALALTMTAGAAGLAWQEELRGKLDRPTPFTLASIGIRGATKSRLIATVFVKDIAAQYLQPLAEGGPHFLGTKRGLLAPRNIGLNQYGNLPKSRLSQLKAKPGVFVGPVRLRGGQVVSGVWQRTKAGRGKAASRGGALTLLIRFTDPLPAKPVLRFAERAEQAVLAHYAPNFAKALAHALATAR